MESESNTSHNIPLSQQLDWYCDDIKLTFTKANFESLSTFSASNNTDVVRLHYGLKGNYEFTYKQLNTSFDLIGGHHNLMYSKGFDLEMRNKSLEIETFGIQFSKDAFINFTQHANERLQRFSESILLGKCTIFSQKWGALDVFTQQIIYQILHCSYSEGLKKMFLLSKSIELLVLSVEAYLKSEAKREVFIKNKADKEKIIAVRDLINQKLMQPPHLNEIAKTVGLNEYKLKRGFKEVFNNTVFGYLTEQRLHLALQYLKDTDKTSSEIAFLLGYATAQHFNNAFKKKFGFTPNSVRNNPN